MSDARQLGFCQRQDSAIYFRRGGKKWLSGRLQCWFSDVTVETSPLGPPSTPSDRGRGSDLRLNCRTSADIQAEVTQVYRVSHGGHTPATCIYRKGTHKPIRHTAEQNLVEPFGHEKTAIIPQCLLTEITIRLDAHIKRVMPSHVERQSFNRGRVAQVVQLLQEQHANGDVKIFRGAS
jgi:hypothetical protein